MASGNSEPTYDSGYEPSDSNQTGNGSVIGGSYWESHEVQDQGKTYIETSYDNGWQITRTDTETGETTRIK